MNKTQLEESGVKYSLLILRKMVCFPPKTEHAQYAERFRDCDYWQYRDYEPSPSNLTFYDWERGGLADRVDIVERVEDGIVYSVHGNAGDSCIKNSYYIAAAPIYEYGTPAY